METLRRPHLIRTAIQLLLLAAISAGANLHAYAAPKKHSVASSAPRLKAKGSSFSKKKPAATHGKKKTSAVPALRKPIAKSHSSAAYQAYVPVPQARPVAQQSMVTGEGTAVPDPDMAAEQRQGSYAQASPEAAAALSVEDRLAHGQSTLHFASALRPFFEALHAHATEQLPGTTVRVIQFGDSHTAADMFTGEMRSQMQARFGDGGVGFTYAGHPFAGYRILGSGRGQSGGWTTLGTHFTQLGDAQLGLGGVAIETSAAGEDVSLSVNCTTLDVHFLRRDGGGSFTVMDNGQVVHRVSTRLEPPSAVQAADPSKKLTVEPSQAGIDHLDCLPGHNDFTLTTVGDGPVRLLGTVALQPGITWESAGINGAEAPLIQRWNQRLFDAYLDSWPLRLIVLAYGTNEAAARWTEEDYRNAFAQLVDHLHAISPQTSILVLGPGDRSVAASSGSTRAYKGRRIRRKVYVPYSATARIIEAQRETCRTHNCAFWDWSARQGGLGSMQRWVASGLAQPDYTHLTGTGYRALADALFADIMASYAKFNR